MEARREEVAPLGEEGVEAGAAVLEVPRSLRTLKLMSLSWEATPSRSSSRMKLG